MASVHQLVCELAAYENAAEEVTASITDYEQDGFGVRPFFEILLAESAAGKIEGMAFFYDAYSTWKGRILYLDDLIVSESSRNKGLGTLLFNRLIDLARERNARQLRWHVLDWNDPAISFYKKYAADLDPEWITGRLSLDQMNKLDTER